MARSKGAKKQKLLLPEKKEPKPKLQVPPLSALPVSSQQSRKAIQALLAHLATRKQGNSLIENEEWVQLVLTTKKISPRERHLPYQFGIPHPLMDPKKAGVCLLVKDPASQTKKLLDEAKVSFVTKVVGLEKLKGKYKPFEARRQLLDTYAIFLADDRVVPTLPKLLGKQWLDRKRQPIPVSLKPKSIKANLEKALTSTSYFVTAGTCSTIRLGVVGTHSEDEIVANLEAVLPQLAVRVPQGWDNVQALHIKTSTTVSLPIWNADIALVVPLPAVQDEEEEAEVLPELEEREEVIQQAIADSAKSERPSSVTKSSGSKKDRKRRKSSAAA